MAISSIQNNDVAEVLKTINSSMQLVVNVKDSTDNGDGTFTLDTCNTHYLRDCSLFNIGNDEYSVESFDLNRSVTYKPLSGAPEILGDFTLRNPLFLIGTPRMTQEELSQRKSELDRHPFIWLLEVFASRFPTDPINPISNYAPVTLFFLDSSDNDMWLNSDHREQIIRPMKGLIDSFIQASKDSKLIQRDFIGSKDVSVIDRVRYGKYEQNKGHTAQLLGEKLSGVEIRIEFPILEFQRCSNNNC